MRSGVKAPPQIDKGHLVVQRGCPPFLVGKRLGFGWDLPDRHHAGISKKIFWHSFGTEMAQFSGDNESDQDQDQIRRRVILLRAARFGGQVRDASRGRTLCAFYVA
jgi:hypothetical protein